MNGYRQGVYEAWDQASKEFPRDFVRRRQRYAELLREAQGLEPNYIRISRELVGLLQEAVK